MFSAFLLKPTQAPRMCTVYCFLSMSVISMVEESITRVEKMRFFCTQASAANAEPAATVLASRPAINALAVLMAVLPFLRRKLRPVAERLTKL